MATSVRIQSEELFRVSVSVNGQQFGTDVQIDSIVVETAINRIPCATVRIVDGSAAEESFELSSGADFVPGAKLEIAAGYQEQLQPIFKGLIQRHAISIAENGETHLVISGADPAVSMARVRHSRHFTDSSDSDALAKIIGEAGFTSDVSNTVEVYSQSVQHNATDWDYVLMRAAANGMIVLVNDGKLTIAPPDLSDPEFSARFGDSILSFDAEMDTATQISQVDATTWDSANQGVINVSSHEPETNEQGNLAGDELAKALKGSTPMLRGYGPLSQRTLKTWANAHHLASRMARIQGRVTFSGNANVVAGRTLELAGLGKRFNGPAYLSAVTHRITGSEWTSEARFGVDQTLLMQPPTDVDAPPAAGLRPSTHGTQIAKVRQVYGDPTGQGRIKVAFPMSGNVTLWVRMLTPYAGDEMGIQFLPEQDDEVVISFVDNDPDSAICLGALHSGSRPPPESADETNMLKTLRTRSGLTLQFNDNATSVELSAPSGRRISLDDDAGSVTLEDREGNSVEMNKAGIALKSKGDISINAEGDVSIASGLETSLEASQGMTIKALNLNQKASETLEVNARSAEVTASGILMVRGTLVKID